MRIIATTIWCVLLTLPLLGQHEVPLSGNPVLENYYQNQLQDDLPTAAFFTEREKEGCTMPVENAIPINAGQSYTQLVEIDTFDLGADGFYQCTNCGSLSFGSASLAGDTLTYTANMGILAEVETVSIRYCDATGVNCTNPIDFDFLIRRPGENLFPAAIAVNPGEIVQLTATNNLPGALRCNFFIDCIDNYDGRDQLAYFTDYGGPTEEFIYRASRFDGIDSLCLVLCDEFGICDTTHYAFRIDIPSQFPPAYDDFSYAGPVPSDALWLDQEVYINTELPIDPRSVGVATFDGLSNRGRPYGAGYGEADRLTSTYFNTSSGDWTLSFWLQRGGLADRPELRDSLILQFRDTEGDWISMQQFTGIPANQPFFIQDTFRFFIETISEDFQHDRFQFRFVNYNDRSGFRDAWHLDYVRLDNNPSDSEIFNDIAFTRPPDFILANYTSMPWRHFQPRLNEELAETIDVGVYNHFATAQNASPSTVILEEQNTSVNPFESVPTLFNGLEVNLDNGVPVNRMYNLMGDETGFSNVWPPYTVNMGSDLFDFEEELEFRLDYNLQNTSQEGLDFVERNDAVSRSTYFSNYFAYDDGTAESSIETSAGRIVAVAFDAAVPDTIQGVRFHFPHTAEDFSTQEMYLNIWIGELDESAEYRIKYQPVYASTFFDTLQGFTSYELLNAAGEPAPLAIPAGTFYVGWEQVSTCQFGRCIAVGYDRNRPQGVGNIFVNPGGGWEPISGVTEGALMLRPVMSGGEAVGTTSTDEVVVADELRISPNPSRGLIYLQGPQWAADSQVQIFSNTGQLLQEQAYAEHINISNLPAGMYFVRLLDKRGNYTTTQRLIVIK